MAQRVLGLGVCELTLLVLVLLLRSQTLDCSESTTIGAVGCTLHAIGGPGEDWQETPQRPITLWTAPFQNGSVVFKPQSNI